MICKDTWPGNKKDPKADTQILLKSLNVKDQDFRLGKTKVFLRQPTTVSFFPPKFLFNFFY